MPPSAVPVEWDYMSTTLYSGVGKARYTDTGTDRGLPLGEACPISVLKFRSSGFLGFLLSKRYFDPFPARGKLPIKSVFHSKTYSLLYVGFLEDMEFT